MTSLIQLIIFFSHTKQFIYQFETNHRYMQPALRTFIEISADTHVLNPLIGLGFRLLLWNKNLNRSLCAWPEYQITYIWWLKLSCRHDHALTCALLGSPPAFWWPSCAFIVTAYVVQTPKNSKSRSHKGPESFPLPQNTHTWRKFNSFTQSLRILTVVLS